MTRRPLSRSKVKVTGPLWLAVLAGQHGHWVSDGSICVYDVYRVTTCRPGQEHIVAAYCLQLVLLAITPGRFLWYFWRWFSQFLACPHISSMPVNDCLTSQLKQSCVMSIDCSLVCVHLVLVWWWLWFDGSFAHHVAAVVTTTSVTTVKCRMETFWYRLIQAYHENWPLKWGERASGCVVCRGCEWSCTVFADWSAVRFGFGDNSHENGWLIRALVTSRLKHNISESDE